VPSEKRKSRIAGNAYAARLFLGKMTETHRKVACRHFVQSAHFADRAAIPADSFSEAELFS
jgi:hypothetical protein